MNDIFLFISIATALFTAAFFVVRTGYTWYFAGQRGIDVIVLEARATQIAFILASSFSLPFTFQLVVS